MPLMSINWLTKKRGKANLNFQQVNKSNRINPRGVLQFIIQGKGGWERVSSLREGA